MNSNNLRRHNNGYSCQFQEGGPGNEWRLKFLNVTNPVQLRCNACDYYTNSLHKLQLHAANQRHEISTILFSHLKKCEDTVLSKIQSSQSDDDRSISMQNSASSLSYRCCLCKYSGPGKLPLMAHVRSMKHLQMEQVINHISHQAKLSPSYVH